MKVIFNCSYRAFHRDFVINIKKELEKRGHIGIITESSDEIMVSPRVIENEYRKRHSDADFTVLPDEACTTISGTGIYINHCILPVIPCHAFYYEDNFRNAVETNASYLFLASDDIAKLYTNEIGISKPVVVAGFPKIDMMYRSYSVSDKIKQKLLNNVPLTLAYLPTGSWKTGITSMNTIDVEQIKYEGIFIQYGHPASDKTNQNYSMKLLSTADIVISDYSSIGYDAIALNIPTILVDNVRWENESPNLLCNYIRDATIRAKTTKEVVKAIKKYKQNPSFLEDKRQEYSKLLNKYPGNSSKIFVDELLNIFTHKHNCVK